MVAINNRPRRRIGLIAPNGLKNSDEKFRGIIIYNKKVCLARQTDKSFSKKRRALDSNQRIPYDIGSLANCWFKPLTQPSLNHLFVKERCKYTTNFSFSKILVDYSQLFRNLFVALRPFENFLYLWRQISKLNYYEKIYILFFGNCCLFSINRFGAAEG